MDVHPPKNGIFIGIDPYPYESNISVFQLLRGVIFHLMETAAWNIAKEPHQGDTNPSRLPCVQFCVP